MSDTNKAIELLNSGGVVALPTDTVYGLSAKIDNLQAVQKIFEIKKRPISNPMITLISDINDLGKLAYIDETTQKIINKFWPGPLTLILKRKLHTPAIDFLCCGLDTISIRMPNHQTLLDIIKQSGPIVSTSANISGEPNPTTTREVEAQLGCEIFILDGGKSNTSSSSTILDLTQSPPKILRLGDISEQEIMTII